MNPLPRSSTKKRILDEQSSRLHNEESMAKVIRARAKMTKPTRHSQMLFDCECDDADCAEMIPVSTEEYVQVHANLRQFIVVTAHVQMDLESVVERFHGYVLVQKFIPSTGT
jgi:hypothetical protein